MTDHNDQMREIEALLRLAAKAGTQEEAASAAAKAAELGVRYGIDLAAMGTAESRAFNSVESEERLSASDQKWVGIIAHAVANLNACRGAFYAATRTQTHIRFTGRMGNAMNAKMQLEYLTQTVNRLNHEAVSGKGFEKRELSAHRRAFRLGAASALMIILREKYEAMRKQGIDQSATGTALVVASYFDQEQAALDQHLGSEKAKLITVQTDKTDRAAFMAGALAAKKINLNAQIAGAHDRKQIGGK